MTDLDEQFLQQRARLSHGGSAEAIYRMVADEITRRNASGMLYDIGCGTGALAGYLPAGVTQYVGVDIVHYDEFPTGERNRFMQTALDSTPWAIPNASADIVTAVETIEHLENPRLFMRELTRICKPGGLVIVTTPNNLSWLSILTLIRKGVFNAFQEGPGLYPAHITALVETDLVRIGREVALRDSAIKYSDAGRVPFTSRHWPRWMKGRRFSDNLCFCAFRSLS